MMPAGATCCVHPRRYPCWFGLRDPRAAGFSEPDAALRAPDGAAGPRPTGSRISPLEPDFFRVDLADQRHVDCVRAATAASLARKRVANGRSGCRVDSLDCDRGASQYVDD